jgi:Antitoxin of toxin-antitoxin, RelE / RelB, TA system
VSIWLPEFQIYGRGSDLSAARGDLLQEVREYVAEYLEGIEIYRSAPNRRAHFAHIIKALVADLSGRLDTVIFHADRGRTGARKGSAAAKVR